MGTADGAPPDGADERDQGQPSVEGDLRAEGQPVGAQRAQEVDTARAHDETEEAPDQGEQDGLRHHVADHLPPARPDALADRELPHPAGGPDEEQVHEVHAADEEQEEHSRLQEQESRPDRGDVVGVEGRHRGVEAGLGDLLRVGELRRVHGIVRVDLRLGLDAGGARSRAICMVLPLCRGRLRRSSPTRGEGRCEPSTRGTGSREEGPRRSSGAGRPTGRSARGRSDRRRSAVASTRG